MDGQILSIVLLLLGLALGALGGWFAGSRPAAELRARLDEAEGEGRELDTRFRAAVKDLTEASLELATLKANAANFEEQKRVLIEAQDNLKKEFENAGAKVLAQAQEALLTRAQERFAQSEEKNEARIKALLDPVGQRLASYEAQVSKLEKERVDAFGQLTSQIEGMRLGQEQVRVEAARLGNSLRNAPKVRGRWGEEQLKNVLEQCGLSEHTDFLTEHSVNSEEGRLRPDAIVKIPGNKQLVIDSKVSLNYYQDSFEANDEIETQNALNAHASAMRTHVQQLSAKSYHSQFANAPDYVVMFVPGEHFITAALDQDPKLWDYAFERRVLIASPTNLVAIARTISQVWQQDGLTKEAREIGKLASDLYESLGKTQDDLSKVGIHLGRAVNSFNDFSRTYDGNVLSRARRLTEKHIKIGKREVSDEIPFVEVMPRHADGGTLEIEGPGEEAEA
ncbi:MAG: DNA recombination protein RmuC [Novosphingobium sp.]|nr:DNA recombination protein RmuC [Novosphingobium sp.]MBX9642738.1 DNA recombination protein RmuC [Novosphingobium sp.]